MLKKFLSISLISFVLISCGGGSTNEPVIIGVTLESSSETIRYNETYTLTWTSNASQCYASGGWIGEKPTSGSETFTAKARGPIGYALECRKNNSFGQAQITVTLEKGFKDAYDFKDDEITELLTMTFEGSSSTKKFTYRAGNYNNDGAQDMLVAMRASDPKDNAEDLHPRFFQVLGGDELTVSELILDGCSSSEIIYFGDFNLDGFQDLVTLPTKTVKTIAGDPVDSNMCFFFGSEDGLDATNWNSDNVIDNSTSIDLNNFAVTSVDPYDISGDGYIDLMLWAKEGDGSTAGLPFYIIANTATNAFVQLSASLVDLDPYLPSNGCSQGLTYLCDWKDLYGTSQVFYNDDLEVDLLGSACISSDLSSCTYTTFVQKFEEGDDFDWSVSIPDALTPSVSSGQSFSKKIQNLDNNYDGYYDIILLENDTKFSIYERQDSIISAQDNGDFQSLIGSSVKFTNEWINLDVDLDNDFDLLAPIDCVQQSCSNKFFSTFEKSSYDTDVSSGVGDITFGATDGSTIITITDVDHDARYGQLVTFSDAEGLGGNITAEALNTQHSITSTPSDDTYTIEVGTAASADDTGNGGSATVGTYVVTTYIWTEEDVASSINLSSNTIDTLWLDSNGDNDIDVISLVESKTRVAGTDIILTSTYTLYHHENDSLR